jgi:hypothetical protein
MNHPSDTAGAAMVALLIVTMRPSQGMLPEQSELMG